MFAKVNIGGAGHKGSDSRSVSSVYKLAVIRYRTVYRPGKCLYYAGWNKDNFKSNEYEWHLVLTYKSFHRLSDYVLILDSVFYLLPTQLYYSNNVGSIQPMYT